MIEDFDNNVNEQQKQNEAKFEPKGTKIDPSMAVVWDAVCAALGTDTYHMLQHFIYTMIRMASDQHSRTPEMERLMAVLETDIGWQNAINLCAPNGKLSIAQMVLVVEQEDRKGLGLVMIDKPFMGDCQQTENVNYIIDRVIEVGLHPIYQRLRRMKAELECDTFADVMLTMMEAQDVVNATEGDRREGPQMGNQSDYGREIVLGRRFRQHKHRTPDSLANAQQRITFDDYDREVADYEAEDWEGCHHDHADDVERSLGTRPFDVES